MFGPPPPRAVESERTDLAALHRSVDDPWAPAPPAPRAPQLSTALHTSLTIFVTRLFKISIVTSIGRSKPATRYYFSYTINYHSVVLYISKLSGYYAGP